MLTLARYRTLNWKCYAGDTVLALEAKPYALVARDVLDADRSNWLGKSSMGEAIEFAVTGQLPRSCKDRPKTSWITKGAKSGEVDLTISNGARILRTQSLTGSEKLYYYPPGAGPNDVKMQDEAQKEINAVLGITREDWATWSFRQGEMARLLRLESGELAETFSKWLRLGKLEECEAMASQTLAELSQRERDAAGEEREARRTIEAIFLQSGAKDEAELRELVRAATSAESSALAESTRLQEERAKNSEKATIAPHAARYDGLVKEGTELAATLGQFPAKEGQESKIANLRVRLRELGEKRAIAETEHVAASHLVEGRFDGRCPLVGDACPAASFVTDARVRNTANEKKKRAAFEELSNAYTTASRELVEASDQLRAYERETQRLDQLRAQARGLKDAKKRWAALPDPTFDDAELLTQIAAAVSEHHARMERRLHLGQLLDLVQQAQASAEKAAGRAAAAAAAARIAGAGVVVFDKSRRKIAEQVFGQVEGVAVDMLAGAGIDLDVRIAWGRVGRGLAEICRACGATFGASQRIKVCAGCGAERPPKYVDKLDVEVRGLPSASGGADDVGGLMLQFATSRWLRAERGSAWALAVLDEPFGHLDAANRRAFSSALPRMLSECGFAQALVVAHHDGILDALPGRIEITSEGGRSTARVAA